MPCATRPLLQPKLRWECIGTCTPLLPLHPLPAAISTIPATAYMMAGHISSDSFDPNSAPKQGSHLLVVALLCLSSPGDCPCRFFCCWMWTSWSATASTSLNTVPGYMTWCHRECWWCCLPLNQCMRTKLVRKLWSGLAQVLLSCSNC